MASGKAPSAAALFTGSPPEDSGPTLIFPLKEKEILLTSYTKYLVQQLHGSHT